MLLLLFQYLLLFILTRAWGYGTARLLQLRFENNGLYSLLGLLALALLARWWSLFAPFSGWFLLVVSLPATFFHFRFASPLRLLDFRGKEAWLFTAITVFVLLFCSQQSISYDEALYHAATIQWANDYGTVPGLANLHGRLGFNSGWHLFASGFNLECFLGRPSNAINGWLLLWSVMFWVEEARKKGNTVSGRLSTWLPLTLFFPLLLIYHLIDPSADYAAALLTCIALYLTHTLSEKEEQAQRQCLSVVIALLVAFLLTVKLSTLSCAMLCLALPLVGASARQWLLVMGGFLFFLLPWLWGNYVLSGYVLYPYLSLPGLHPIWQVPAAQAALEAQGIRWTPFVRWTGMNYAQLERTAVGIRYNAWFRGIRAGDKVLFSLTALVLPLSVYIRRRNRFTLLATGSALLGFALALWSAPDFRFAAPYLFWGVAVAGSAFFKKRLPLGGQTAAILVQLVGTLALYAHLKPKVLNPAANSNSGLAFQVLFPEKYPLSSCDSILLNGQKIYRFDEQKLQFNWNKIPGAYLPLPPTLFLLDGKTIGGGFGQQKADTTVAPALNAL